MGVRRRVDHRDLLGPGEIVLDHRRVRHGRSVVRSADDDRGLAKVLELRQGQRRLRDEPDQRGLIGRVGRRQHALHRRAAGGTALLDHHRPLAQSHAGRDLGRDVRLESNRAHGSDRHELRGLGHLSAGLDRAAHHDARLGCDDRDAHSIAPRQPQRSFGLAARRRTPGLQREQLRAAQRGVRFQRDHRAHHLARGDAISDVDPDGIDDAGEGRGHHQIALAPPLARALDRILEVVRLDPYHLDRDHGLDLFIARRIVTAARHGEQSDEPRDPCCLRPEPGAARSHRCSRRPAHSRSLFAHGISAS